MKVKRRYCEINGIVNDGGRIFEISNKNTTNARRMDIHRVIFSPASAGKINTDNVTNEISTHGIIKFTV